MDATDTLKKVTVEYLYHGLRHPKPELEARIRQLRVVRDMDKKQYSLLKRQLPFVVCGIFNPPVRRKENFAFTEYFILDIDCVSEKGYDISVLRSRLEADDRIMLSFVSPSENGLKLLFRLKDKCYDSAVYSLFYRAFVRQFSSQYGLEQVVDSKTCDVSRACFVSVDAAAFYRPDAVAVSIGDYIQMDDCDEMLRQQRVMDSSSELSAKEEVLTPKDPDVEKMERIKDVLNPLRRKKPMKESPFVPQRLAGLKSYVESTGVVVYEIVNIQYAKKIRCKVGLKEAEINLFYGKRGFNVVQSPRCGTSTELNKLVSELILDYLEIST